MLVGCRRHATLTTCLAAGVPAELPPDYRPNLWPDFMGKEPFRSYPGNSVLGEIFRMVRVSNGMKSENHPDSDLLSNRSRRRNPKVYLWQRQRTISGPA